MTKSKPWRTDIGVSVGLLVGALLWWRAYDLGAGLFQNPQFLLVPPAAAIFFVDFRNRRKKVGPYDPKTIAQNRSGRV